MASAITMMFITVPSPGRWRSGIHSASTATDTPKVVHPMPNPVRTLSPWASTDHGEAPRAEARISASPVPNNHSPPISAVSEPGVGRQTDGAVNRVRGTVREPRNSELTEQRPARPFLGSRRYADRRPRTSPGTRSGHRGHLVSWT